MNNLFKSYCSTGKILFIIFSFLLFSEVFLNSAPKKKTKGKKDNPAEITEPAEENSVIENSEDAVRLPSNVKPRTFFYGIDPQILDEVENGSPDSIKSAMSKLRKNDTEYNTNEKILMNISAGIMEIMWPSEKVTWETFEIAESNSYTGALNSVKNGVFDSSTGNVDFLSTAIPALVLFTKNINSSVYQQCETSVNGILELKPDSVLGNYVAGIYYKKTGDNSKSEIYLKKAYSKSSSSLELILDYANVLVLNNKATVASQVLATIPVDYTENLQVLKQRAYVAFNNKEYSAAENYVAKVLQQTPNDLEFLLFRARIFIEKNDYIHAVSLLDMYARQNDTNIDYLVLRARVQLDWSKNTTAATETVEKALRLYPENEAALMLATKISSVTDAPVAGKYADELAEIVLQKNPQNDEALIYALEGLVQRENWKEAYEISSKLVINGDCDPDVIFRHVIICTKLGKGKDALDVATKAYSKNPDNESLIQAYVLAYSESNSRDSSLSLINSLLNSSSSKMKSYLYYRRSYLQHSEETALADLRSSLIANPRNSDALFRLYEIYYSKADYRKAQYYLRQVVAINPNDSSTRKLNEALTQLIQ